MQLLFATTNSRKIAEAKAACEHFGIEIVPITLDIIEIQSVDPKQISQNKVNQAFNLAQKPIVVTDTSWNIPALNGFPGGYMKDIAHWFESKDFLNLLQDKTDRRISFTESIYYQDQSQIKSFSKEYWGEFATTPKGTGISIENVAVFNGVTLGERRQQGTLSHDPKDYIWYEFAQWYSAHVLKKS